MPGAYRVDSTSFGSSLEDAAFRNPDGSMVVVVYNGSTASRSFRVLWRGESFHATLPAGAIATLTWR